MSTDSNAPGRRFRSGAVVASTPEARVQELLGDGVRMFAVYEDQLREAGQAGDVDLVVRLATVAGRAADAQRAYAAQRLAASLLVTMASQLPRDSDERIAPLDAAVGLLAPVLDTNPHEPELLDLLGVASYELGDVTLARRIFEAVCELEPGHEGGRLHVRSVAAAQRAKSTPAAAPERLAPHLTAARATIRSIVERAVRVPERSISLCMIVKDEEDMLPGCLAAVAPFVDELVIVDTGSTDRTREIAAEYGAKVIEFEWNGSFSDARNESLRHATSDWILWLDADEHLVAADGPQLRDLARRTWVEGFSIIETHLLGSGDGETASHAPMRLFRRRPQYVWRGTVHEQVAWALPSWLPGRVQQSTIRVDHYGYLASVVEDRAKGERNLSLLMSQLEQDRSAFPCFNIGTEHAQLGDWGEARRWFEEALTLARAVGDGWTGDTWVPLLVSRAVTARRLTGSGFEALELAGEALTWWPDYTDLEFERAQVHADAGEWEPAAAHARAALELGDAPARYVAVSGKGSFQARHLLATVLRASGDSDGARAQLELALEEAPYFLTSLTELADLLLRGGDEPATVSEIVDTLLGARADRTQPNVLLGAVFHEAGAFDVAEERYERALAASPTSATARVARAELRLAQRRLQDAWDDAMTIGELDPYAGVAGMTAFLAAAAMGDAPKVAAAAERIARSTTIPPAERSVYVAWRQLLDPSETVHVLMPTGPGATQVLMRNLEALARLEATDAFEQLHPLVAKVVPDGRERGLRLADLYLRLQFADMAGEELMLVAQHFGPDATVLAGLGRVATMKQMWEDAEVFLTEALQLDPSQQETSRLLAAVRERIAG
ncbi:MAG: glycosyltransferase [Thermoleophilia bacterium]|nr:glycosyltransferase [Thermoleophilia bacterium]